MFCKSVIDQTPFRRRLEDNHADTTHIIWHDGMHEKCKINFCAWEVQETAVICESQSVPTVTVTVTYTVRYLIQAFLRLLHHILKKPTSDHIARLRLGGLLGVLIILIVWLIGCHPMPPRSPQPH